MPTGGRRRAVSGRRAAGSPRRPLREARRRRHAGNHAGDPVHVAACSHGNDRGYRGSQARVDAACRRHAVRRGVLNPLLRGLPRSCRWCLQSRLGYACGGAGDGARSSPSAGVVATAHVFGLLTIPPVRSPSTARRDIVANRQIVVDRAVTGGRGAFASAAAYLAAVWWEAVGWPVLPARGAASRWSAASPRSAALLALVSAGVSRFHQQHRCGQPLPRPVLPFVALFAAFGLDAHAGSTLRRGSPEGSDGRPWADCPAPACCWLARPSTQQRHRPLL